MNQAQLIARIEEEAGVETEELPIVRSVVWFPQRSPLEVSLLYGNIPDDNAGLGRPVGSKEAAVKALMDGMKPTVFRVGNRCPLNPVLSIVSIFDNDTEARVYCAPVPVPGEPMPAGGAEHYSRYTLSKAASVFTLTIMSEEVFINEAAAEWSDVFEAYMEVLDGLGGDDEDEEKEDKETPEGETAAPAEPPAAPAAPSTTAPSPTVG